MKDKLARESQSCARLGTAELVAQLSEISGAWLLLSFCRAGAGTFRSGRSAGGGRTKDPRMKERGSQTRIEGTLVCKVGLVLDVSMFLPPGAGARLGAGPGWVLVPFPACSWMSFVQTGSLSSVLLLLQ